MTPHLLLAQPLRVGSLELRNRIVFAAHLTNFAEDGAPSARHAAYYGARAAGGVGLVVTEEFTVVPGDRPYERSIAGWSPQVDVGSRRLTDAVHAAGAPVLAQLNHNGGQGSGMYSQQPVDAPSAVSDPMFREVPVALDAAGLARVVEGFAATARRCVANGFDGVELQCSQAALLHAFLAPATNRRDDAYGGSLAGRMRLLLEVVAAVRAAVGRVPVLGVRLGVDDPASGGVALADVVATGRALDASGSVDYVSTTMGVATSSLHRIEASMATTPGHALPVARALRAAVGIPVIGVGRLVEPQHAEQALADGDCDLVAVVRGQIADPAFARKAIAGRPVRRCLGCNQDCIGRVGINADLACVLNPEVGQEAAALPAPRLTAPPLTTSVGAQRAHVVVVGGGPAGLSAAVTAAGRGYQVTVLEAASQVGGQLATAARGPHRDGLAHLSEDLLAESRDAGVEIRTGVTADVALVRHLRPDAVVVATGARPVPPSWADPGAHVLDVGAVLAGALTPSGSVLVVDELGSHAATSVAELLADRGIEVEILTPGLVVGQDLGLTLDLPGWKQRAAARGIREWTEQVVLSATGDTERGEVVVTVLEHTTGRSAERRCSAVVVVAHPRADDQLWSALREALPPAVPVLRVGDCLAPRQAGEAVRDGWAAAVSL